MALQFFQGKGGRLTGLTPIGRDVLERAKSISLDVAYISSICKAGQKVGVDSLTIAATHVQSCYVLPEIISRFSRRYPKVKITLRQTTPSGIIELLQRGEADLGVTSDPPKSKDIVALPCLNFERIVVVPNGHPLLNFRRCTLKALINYPLVTYESSYKARGLIIKSFSKSGLNPSIVLSVSDADIIKACVEKGIGIGVLVKVAYDQNRDIGIKSIPSEGFFPKAKVCAMLNRNHYVQFHTYDFIEEISGTWSRSNIQKAIFEKHKAVS